MECSVQDRVELGERIPVVPGLSMPFYPARPVSGIILASPALAVRRLVADMNSGHVCQPKLNGDRACVGVVEIEGRTRVVVQNRHGTWCHQAVRNAQAFASLGAGTCFDGEIIGGLFYPFECLAFERVSTVRWPTSQRVKLARLSCLNLGVEWIFDPLSFAAVRRLRANLPLVEGWVRKTEAHYPIGGSASSETPLWVKLKW